MGINNNPKQPSSGGGGGPDFTLFPVIPANDGWWDPTTPNGITTSDRDLQIQTVNNNIIRACIVRFPGVNIAQGVVVSAAELTVSGGTTQVGSKNVNVRGADEDNIVFPASGTIANAIVRTTATTIMGDIVPDQVVNLDVTAIVNELLARVAWAPGNAMAFIWDIQTNLINRTKTIRGTRAVQTDPVPTLKIFL